MSDGTKIEWTEATWNPITGCSVVSPGCTNCYAMTLAGTRLKHHPSRAGLTRPTKTGGHVWTGDVRLNEQWLDQPLRWRKPRMIFVCAHGDLFHEGVPDDWIDQVFAVMACAPQHVFQVLTKRPERMRAYMADHRCTEMVGEQALDLTTRHPRRDYPELDWEHPDDPCRLAAWPPPNVWLGVSAEDQERTDERIPILLDTPAAVRWVSAEPLLGPIDLIGSDYQTSALHPCSDDAKLDWVVVGGESGRSARPCDVEWIRSIVEQCRQSAVPVFVKQFGARSDAPGITSKGGDPAEWPADLRVREFPRGSEI